jgi:ribonuclease HI
VPPHHLRGAGGILKITAWIDGGARGNPGPAGWGALLVRDDSETIRLRGFLGITTNNVAEYTALVEALEAAREEGASRLDVFSDSLLLVNQMNGVYRVKHPNLIPLYQKAIRVARGFSSFSVSHVRREHNREADRLANEAMDRRIEIEVERSPHAADDPG